MPAVATTEGSTIFVEAWRREALRVYRRYQREIVEACGLCPWAESAREERRVREIVLLDTQPRLEPALGAIDVLAADRGVEVGLLLFPRLRLARPAFEELLARLREVDADRHGLGRIPFAMASFHPDAQADLSQPERLIPFLRRTPDPTLQLVRSSVLEDVREAAPQGTQFVDVRSLEEGVPAESLSLRERIARTNLATARRLGVAELARRLDDIRRDRDAAYRALGAEDVD